MHLKKQLLLILIIFSIQVSNLKLLSSNQSDRIRGCIFGGLIGDCLGKPTEFIHNFDEIFKKYPNGIRSYQDIKKYNLCWKNEETGELYAPYTDDTAMARVTLKILLESRINNWDLDHTMRELAKAYILDMDNPNGWAMNGRALGMACWNNLSKLKYQLNLLLAKGDIAFQWQAGGMNDMGCGSVMRAHPFGVVFADDPEKAAYWAAQHSKITHAHPSAQAACAAMAIAVAYAIQGKSKEFILEQIISTAKKYDTAETHFNPYKKIKEKSSWGKIQDALSYADAFHAKEIICGDKFNYFEYIIKESKIVFEKYQGWAADDAIAAVSYIFAISFNNVHNAICLGVHTSGDSDSLGSMGGAIVGAFVGAKQFHHDFYDNNNPSVFSFYNFEGARILEKYANQASQLIKQ